MPKAMPSTLTGESLRGPPARARSAARGRADSGGTSHRRNRRSWQDTQPIRGALRKGGGPRGSTRGSTLHAGLFWFDRGVRLEPRAAPRGCHGAEAVASLSDRSRARAMGLCVGRNEKVPVKHLVSEQEKPAHLGGFGGNSCLLLALFLDCTSHALLGTGTNYEVLNVLNES